MRAKITMEIAATTLDPAPDQAPHRGGPPARVGHWRHFRQNMRILLQDKAADMRQMWENERDYTTNVTDRAGALAKGYGVEQAFPEFIARRGR